VTKILSRLVPTIVIACALLAACSSGSSKLSPESPSPLATKRPVTTHLLAAEARKVPCYTNHYIKVEEMILDLTGDGVDDGIAFYACVASAGRSREISYFAIGNYDKPDVYDTPFNPDYLRHKLIELLDEHTVKIYFDEWSSTAGDCCSDETGDATVTFRTGSPIITDRNVYPADIEY